MKFSGTIIKETLMDELILDLLAIEKVEIWKTQNSIKYWTMIWFSSDTPDLPEQLSKVIIKGAWFADMIAGNVKYIVLNSTVLKYTIGNLTQKAAILDECRRLGIPDQQLLWDE